MQIPQKNHEIRFSKNFRHVSLKQITSTLEHSHCIRHGSELRICTQGNQPRTNNSSMRHIRLHALSSADNQQSRADFGFRIVKLAVVKAHSARIAAFSTADPPSHQCTEIEPKHRVVGICAAHSATDSTDAHTMTIVPTGHIQIRAHKLGHDLTISCEHGVATKLTACGSIARMSLCDKALLKHNESTPVAGFHASAAARLLVIRFVVRSAPEQPVHTPSLPFSMFSRFTGVTLCSDANFQ